jgi:hypothetical protein
MLNEEEEDRARPFTIQHFVFDFQNPPRLLFASMPIEQRQPQGLVDILDKILDKGLVVAGDIKVSLANVELLTIQLRLVICSIDKAEAIGINWWRSDRFYSAAPNAGTVSAEEYDALKARMNELEAKLEGRALPRATQTKADERKGR